MIDRFLRDAFVALSCPFWSTVLQNGARLPIHTLNSWTVKYVVPVFLTGSVFECDIAHLRSVAVLYMMYKIRCDLMHPLYGALPVPNVRIKLCALVAHRYTYAHIRCRTSQYRLIKPPSQFLFICPKSHS